MPHSCNNTLFTSEEPTIQLLTSLPIELVEPLLINIKQNHSADIIFKRILLISATCQTKFVFFDNDFKALLGKQFKDKADDVLHTMLLLKRKIEDYNLTDELANKEDRTTIASPINEASSSTDMVVTKQTASTNKEILSIHEALSEIVKDTMRLGRQILKTAVDQLDYRKVRQYIAIADCEQNPQGDTILHIAASTGDPKMIQQVLLAKVISRTVENNAGLTPIHLVCYTAKTAAFLAIYTESITLNASHLRETLRNPLSHDEDKCGIINQMFSKGMQISASELAALIDITTLGVRRVLTYIYDVYISIKNYITDATKNTRIPELYNDIAAVSTKIPFQIIKFIIKRTNIPQPQSRALLRLLETAEDYGVSPDTIASIITRVHQEIPHRGRINAVIAAVILGDLDFLNKMACYDLNLLNLTPNHRNTLDNNAVLKPIIFAVQFARYDIFSFIDQQKISDVRENLDERLLLVKRYKTNYEHLLCLFKEHTALQNNYPAFYQELIICCQAIIKIDNLLCFKSTVENTSNVMTASKSMSSIFHHASDDHRQINDSQKMSCSLNEMC